MAPMVVIVSRLQLVRQGIAQRLALVGAAVEEYADTSSALQILRDHIPDVMILDVEDTAWSWRSLLPALSGTQRKVRVVLLARRMGIDEAAEAKRLGVGGVILKPFREEEHMQRLVALVNESKGVIPRRLQPRFYPEPESQSMLTLAGPVSALYRIVNISLGGVCVAEPKSGLRELVEAVDEVPIRLSAGGIHLGASCRVVHSADGLIGAKFHSLTTGRSDFLEHMGGMHSRVFGLRRIRGRW